MAGAYGFYKENELKLTSYNREANPLKLGFHIVEALYYSWPEELYKFFEDIIIVPASNIPNEYEFNKLTESLGITGINKNKYVGVPFERILGERQSDLISYFIAMRHSGLRYMVDGIENIKTYGIIDWVYIYNLDKLEIEVYYKKAIAPEIRTLTENPYIYLKENFDLIHTMSHNPSDLGRNQFDFNGMKEASALVPNERRFATL